jgi:hypothetical protein
LARVVTQLSTISNEHAKALEACKPACEKNAEGWNEDIKEYYEIQKPTKTEDTRLDTTK